MGDDREALIRNSAEAFRRELLLSRGLHLKLNGNLPKEDLNDILREVEALSMVDQGDDHQILMPYISASFEEIEQLHHEPFYRQFYGYVADKILESEIFNNETRYIRMAKWIKNNFDRFAYFDEIGARAWEEYNIKRDQVFINVSHAHFGVGLQKFLRFFSSSLFSISRLQPILYLGNDIPVIMDYDSLKQRFDTCIKGVEFGRMRRSMDGQENENRLKNVKKHIDDYLIDENPEELKRLGRMASRVFNSEYCFMKSGLNATIISPKWASKLVGNFAGTWSGTYHPLLWSGINPDSYAEEESYVNRKEL
jgi:hypothetical protein